MMNGYFQLVAGKNGTAIKVFRGTNGDPDATAREITEYLHVNGLDFNPTALDNAIRKGDGEPVDIIATALEKPIPESFDIDMSLDQMEVTVRFYPPSENGPEIDSEKVISTLNQKKIVFGIDEQAINSYFNDRKYCTNYVVAKGIPTREGQDAKITFSFDTNLRIHPETREDGSVDYYNLNLINHCKKGDVLATLTPADMGEGGCNVLGAKTRPKNVKSMSLKGGKNVTMSEDKLTLTADVDGHVSLQEGKVVVSNVLSLKEVDLSTGNIVYDGSVEIAGSVASGFKVEAGGNIQVKGNIEGAHLKAAADVIIERGVNGMGEGVIEAGGNIVTKFIENAKVYAVGSVVAGSIINSHVESGTEITVNGKRGNIVGGHVVAAEKITAKALSNDMGTNTIIEVGADPQLKAKIRDTMKFITDSTKQLQQIRPTLDAFVKKVKSGVKLTKEQMEYARKLSDINSNLTKSLDEQTEALTTMQDQLSQTMDASVAVEGICHSGATIVIGDVSMVVKNDIKFSRFVRKDGEVKIAPLS
ncbi:DUF342 domain-containing protein [Butyrivibrio sp. NC3005]|uniref:DUF342 domain-containing protein n=1 Tax=Butyrivibrio sp. NC3005 TaxID=1280685 RepID=UPI00040D6B47|nr:FapA family protein [Butyrivibrio sp. NC3005]